MLGLIRVVSIDPVLSHIADFLQASAYLTGCTALLLLRAVYNVGYSAALGPEKPGERTPAFLTVLDVVMDSWPTFGIFCILFMLRGKMCGYSVTNHHITPSCLGDKSQRANSIYSHDICLRTADNVNSTLQELQVYEDASSHITRATNGTATNSMSNTVSSRKLPSTATTNSTRNFC